MRALGLYGMTHGRALELLKDSALRSTKLSEPVALPKSALYVS